MALRTRFLSAAPLRKQLQAHASPSFSLYRPCRTSFARLTPPILVSKKHASTTTTEPSSPTTGIHHPTNPLSWDEFLRLRRIRRFYNLGASVGTSFSTLVFGMSILAQQNMQTLSQQFFGQDPLVIIAIATTGFAALGWLMGPIVGSQAFRLVYRRYSREIAAKEKDFFERIKKYRVDPTSSSMQNPVPDYYGEKITSVKGYRQWLKDQRAFNKKRQVFL